MRWSIWLGLAVWSTTAVGCSMDMTSADVAGGMNSSGGDFGATQGGVQDMSFARQLVEEGKVPPASAFVVEAMFSEHDLPLTGAPCAETLCLRSAMGVAPNASADPAAWVQVGMSSTINPETFERPSLSLVATVDVSGSMNWSYGSHDTPGELSRTLLSRVAAQLGEGDRFTLVTYGSSVSQPLAWTVGGSGAIDAAIAALGDGGSTNMEAGLQRAYQVAQEAIGSTDQVRIMLFTDVQPNVGATSGTEFQSMAAAGAEAGVGLTVFGMGLGLGAEVMTAMSHLRGGNAFTVMDPDAIDPLMEDSWPWMVSPIAYDLRLAAKANGQLSLTRGYGFPTSEGSADLEVATVFLSRRKGAMLLELAPGSGAVLEGSAVQIDLSYADEQGNLRDESLSASYAGQPLDERGAFMPQVGIDKTVALALLVSGMHEAADSYATSKPEGIARLESTLERFAQDATAIGDPDIDAEADFWPKLLDLMKQGAPMGNLYGGY